MSIKICQRLLKRYDCSLQWLRHFSISQRCLKDDSSKKNDAASKLQSLLQSIVKDEALAKEDSSLKMKSTETIVPKKKKIKAEKPKDLGKKLVESAEEVAKAIPGKSQETEAQLLHRLLYKNKPLSDSIMRAATGRETLKSLLSEMEVEKPTEPVSTQKKQVKDYEYSRADKVRDVLKQKSTYQRLRSSFVSQEKVDLFGEAPLGIFLSKDRIESEVPMNTWDVMKRRDLHLLVTHPPRNIYEQMIIWTERGMLWKFPIDNEQGMEEEKNIDFTEHVFLETHLEDWCPEQGPVRHFMELVCVGLSRNHWLSAQEKREHILWYKDFFSSKKELLLELGAGEIKEAVQQA